MVERKVDEIWTCDRCGKEIINPIIDNWSHFELERFRREQFSFKIKEWLDKDFIKDACFGLIEREDDGGKLVISKHIERDNIDLCPKCKRAFKKFMKWDGDEE